MYLDANATSRLRPEAIASLRWLLDHEASIGNASSVHRHGRNAKSLLEQARASVLSLLFQGKTYKQAKLVFTSGGSEACNQLVFGFLASYQKYPAHVVCSAIEHPAILSCMDELKAHGWKVSFVNPESNGIVSKEAVLSALSSDTALVCLMSANNETGALQPVVEIAQAVREKAPQAAIISDCTQSISKSAFDLTKLFQAGVTAVALSAHKLGAPVGVGAFVLNTDESICHSFLARITGGPQEGRYRAGTENLSAIIAFGAVAKKLLEVGAEEQEKNQSLRELLWNSLSTRLDSITRLTPEPKVALSNTLLVSFSGIRGDDLVVALDLRGISVSTGSACASGKQEASHVVQAMGFSKTQAREVVRFSLDWDASEVEILSVASVVCELVTLMRSNEKLEAFSGGAA